MMFVKGRLPTINELAANASEAISELAEVTESARAEVERRHSSRYARGLLLSARGRACELVLSVYGAIVATTEGAWRLRLELHAIAEGCRDGYAQRAWSLRVVQIATEAKASGMLAPGAS